MTKRYAMLKLLALGPLTIRECYDITGWSRKQVRETLSAMVAEGLIFHDGVWGGMYFL